MNDRRVLLHSFFVAHDSAAKIVCGGTNDGQRRPQFVRNAGRKFHLELSEHASALAGDHDGDETGGQKEQHSEADCEIPFAHLADRLLERSRPVLDHKLPRLTDE